MSKVFVHMGISLDGFVAGVNRGPHNPLGHMGMKVHAWMVHTRAFRENLKLGGGGATGADDEIVRATAARIGANVLGQRGSPDGGRMAGGGTVMRMEKRRGAR